MRVRLPAAPVVLRISALVITLLPVTLAAQAPAALLGTWTLDVARSRYMPGPGPSAETRTYVRGADGVEGVIRRIYADGRKDVIEYRAEFGRDYPVFGARGYDTVRLKRVDERTAEAVLSHAGRVFGTARRTIAEDGRSMTIVFSREDGPNVVRNTAIYRKTEGEPVADR